MSDYLWDKSGEVDPEVARLESALAEARFDPAQHPLRLPPAKRDRTGKTLLVWGAAAIAAALLVAAGAGLFHRWRLDWEPGRAWTVAGRHDDLAVGDTLTAVRPTTVDVARLGVLNVAPGASLSLDETRATSHRVTLNRGVIDVRVWAPPGRVTVRTPAGRVIDLGCIFRLEVDEAGAAHLRVETGWVNLENAHGNSFVPEGASATMRADREPEVPVYDDAPEAFRSAVRRLEEDHAAPDPNLLRAVTFEARERDVITLLTLADVEGMSRFVRAGLLERASILHAPPRADAVQRILDGDRDAFWAWYDSLPLPSLKNWWRNWRDVFPR
jgi:hypothetical protein